MTAATTDLRECLCRAAARAAEYPYRCWAFGEVVAMRGLLDAARATGDDRYRRVVEEAFDRWWSSRRGVLGYKDHVTPGVPLLTLARSDRRWMPAALALGGLFAHSSRVRGVPVHRPDLRPVSAHVWVDCLYTDLPFLAMLASRTGDVRWADLACAQARAYLAALWDPSSGLFWHGYDAEAGRENAVRWGRGNGWAMMGVARPPARTATPSRVPPAVDRRA